MSVIVFVSFSCLSDPVEKEKEAFIGQSSDIQPSLERSDGSTYIWDGESTSYTQALKAKGFARS